MVMCCWDAIEVDMEAMVVNGKNAKFVTMLRVGLKGIGEVEVLRGEERKHMLKNYLLCCDNSAQYQHQSFTLDLRGTPFKVASWKHSGAESGIEIGHHFTRFETNSPIFEAPVKEQMLFVYMWVGASLP